MYTCSFRHSKDMMPSLVPMPLDSYITLLRQVYMHEQRDCQVCSREEEKSIQAGIPAPKFNKSKLIQRQILPANHCWICIEDFPDSKAQILHFSQKHECDSCRKYFDNETEKENHECENVLAFYQK